MSAAKPISYYLIPILRRREPIMDRQSEIIEKVCKKYDVSLDDLKKKCRRKDLVFPRHLLMYLLRKGTNLSLKKIAAIAGLTDHASVLHSIAKIENYIETNCDNRRDEIMELYNKYGNYSQL